MLELLRIAWSLWAPQTTPPETLHAMPARHSATVAMTASAPKEIYNARIYAIALVASMGAFIFGYDLAFIGTTITLKAFERDFGLIGASQSESDEFSANIVSLLQAGCFIGSLAVAPLGERFGRKPSLVIAGIAFCIGSLMQTVSHGLVAPMFVGRAIGGLVSKAFSHIVQLSCTIPREMHKSIIERRELC